MINLNEKYYSEKLSANKLMRCYKIASPRIQQYLTAEITFVKKYLTEKSIALELGCGYGRVMKEISPFVREIHGIDTSRESVELAKEYLKENDNHFLYEMDAKNIAFDEKKFDIVIGIQNSISAFKIDPELLIKQCLRITKKEGIILLSSYAEGIWDERLEWFITQSKEGLLGEINYDLTKDGTIICKDGFKATTYSIEEFENLIEKMNLNATIEIVDNSSVFCIISP